MTSSRLRQLVFASVFALTGLVVGGCAPGQPVVKKSTATPPVVVQTVAVTTEAFRRTSTQPASIHALYQSEVRAKASGFITRVHADIGDVVESGATLATVDVPELAKRVEVLAAKVVRHQAEERRAAAAIDLADANVQAAQAQLAEAKSQMQQVDAMVAAADAEFNRTQDLVSRGSLQERMLDESRQKRDSQRAGKQATQSAINSAAAMVVVAEAKRAAAAADRDAAKTDTEISKRELEELQIMIGYASITSPLSGIVTHRTVEPGDLVGDDNQQSPLFVISQVDRVRVRIPVPENDAPMVNQGDLVTLTLPSFTEEAPITGTVTRSAGSLDPNTRTMLVEMELDNVDGKLLPGMFGSATIDLATKVAANLLPARAIRFRDDGSAYAYVVGEDETVRVATITTGLDDGNRIEVLSGLEPGQRVIDAHLKRFVDGQRVAVTTP